MPSTIPPAPGARVVRALEKAGFTVVRIKGSHYFMRHSDGRRAVVVPVHAGDDVPRGTMRQILASAELTPDEFRELLLHHAELSPSKEAMKTAKCTSLVRRDLRS